MQQVRAYMGGSPADVFVAQEGVRTMHMTQSALPPSAVDAVASVEGVAWAEGLRYTNSIVDSGRGQRITYVLGYDVATGRGGPRRLAAGRPPGRGDALVDEAVAEELDIELDDTVTIMGTDFGVSGTSVDGTNIVNTTVYVRTEDFERPRGDTAAYVLVGAQPGVAPDLLARRTAPPVTTPTPPPP